MSQTLLLLRHAKAEPWNPGVNDHSRPLSSKGYEQMAVLIDALGPDFDLPGAVLCSSSRRTRETLEPFISQWPQLHARTEYTDDIYEASTGVLHELAATALGAADSLMMVGHNPGFEQLFRAVTREQDTHGIHKMPTGTLAVIRFENGYADDAGDGRLQAFLTPKSLTSTYGQAIESR
ncbi:MAG: histidine phosphatase family protein [Xanthomonadales bacterium]|nr:histidine phosphatase family protein [Xanthomonadales bacterium]